MSESHLRTVRSVPRGDAPPAFDPATHGEDTLTALATFADTIEQDESFASDECTALRAWIESTRDRNTRYRAAVEHRDGVVRAELQRLTAQISRREQMLNALPPVHEVYAIFQKQHGMLQRQCDKLRAELAEPIQL